MPEWVHVWFWLRVLREPRVTTPLPMQQEPPPGNLESMPMAAYEHFRNEWQRAGAPRLTKERLAALVDDDPFTEPVPF